jgi:hypothetical protein
MADQDLTDLKNELIQQLCLRMTYPGNYVSQSKELSLIVFVLS